MPESDFKPVVLKYPLGFRISALGMTAVFTACLWLVEGAFAESAFSGWVLVACSVVFWTTGFPEVLRLLAYRFEVGWDYLDVRSWPWRRQRVPLHVIRGFVEDVSIAWSMLGTDVFRFRFFTEGGDTLRLDTLAPGWAGAIHSIHRVAPWAVPDPSILVARAAPKYRETADLVTLVPSPGQDTPEERGWRKRIHPGDAVRGFGIAAITVLPAGVAVALIGMVGFGWPAAVVGTSTSFIVPAIFALFGQYLTGRFRVRRIDTSGGWEVPSEAEGSETVERARRSRRAR